MEEELKYEKQDISATTGPILLKFETQADRAKPNDMVTKNGDNLL